MWVDFLSMELLELYEKRQNNISMFNFSTDWNDWKCFYNEYRKLNKNLQLYIDKRG